MNPRHLTKNELAEVQKTKLEELVEHAGGANHLAFMLNLPVPTTQSYVARGRISKEGAILVEEHPTLGEYFKAKDLRPDINV